MGMTLSVDLGYGLEIPVDEENFPEDVAKKIFEFLGEDPKYIQDTYTDWNGEVTTSYDEYEMFYDLGKKFSLLSFELGTSGDFWAGAAVFIKRLSSTGYYRSATLNANLELTEEEDTQLKEVADLLNLEYAPQIIAIPSYG